MGISIQVEDAHETQPQQGSIGSDRDVTTFGLTIDAFAPATDAGVDIAAELKKIKQTNQLKGAYMKAKNSGNAAEEERIFQEELKKFREDGGTAKAHF